MKVILSNQNGIFRNNDRGHIIFICLSFLPSATLKTANHFPYNLLATATILCDCVPSDKRFQMT